MKKIISAIFIIVSSLVLLTGCSQKRQEFDGVSDIEKFRNSVDKYDSAVFTITDETNGNVVQEFSFMFDGDKQIYLDKQYNNKGEEKIEYSDGVNVWIKDYENDVVKLSGGDDGFAVYTKDNRIIFSTGNMFFYLNGYIGMNSVSTDADGVKTVSFNYDAKKMNEKTGSNIVSIATSYRFDKDGNFEYMTQDNAVMKDGNEEHTNTKIVQSNINSLTSIDNPFEN